MLLSRRVALGGVMVSLGILLLAIASFLPAARLGVAGFAGITVAVVVIADGLTAGAIVWIATSIIAFFLFPNKGAAVTYAIIFGVYPIIKSLAERTRGTVLMWVIKLGAFNILFTILMILYSTVVYDIFGRLNIYIVFGLANAVFVVYDFGFSGIIAVLIKRFGSYLKRG